MRILHCIHGLSGGGAERQLSLLAPEMVRMGHDVHIAYLASGPKPPQLEASGVVLHLLNARSNYDPSIFWQLVKLMREIRPGVVQTWSKQMDVLGGLAASITCKPRILREPNSSEAGYSLVKRWLRILTAIRKSTIVSNSAGGDALWQARIKSQTRRHIIPNAVPLKEISSAPVNSLNDYGLNKMNKVILFAGNFAPRKNTFALMEAFMLVLERDDSAIAVLCGDGPLRKELENKAKETGMIHRIVFTGYISNLWGVMKRANVFSLVSHYEGRPNVVLEAMACGCPLVVSDIPAHREFLDERCAVFVDRHDPEDIARSILHLLDNPIKARKLADAAKKKVTAWSVDSIAEEYEKVYKSVAKIK
ncbi:MAG: glycosyltransferase [Gemmatimonadota bacterium]|nr:glycosyltransferase [Gemmatimonadota bacterium]